MKRQNLIILGIKNREDYHLKGTENIFNKLNLWYIYYNCVTGFFVAEQKECVPDSFYAFENLSPYWIDLFSFDIRVCDWSYCNILYHV